MVIFFESCLLNLVVLVSILISTLYIYFKIAWLHWRKRGVPYTKPTFPFGHFAKMALMRKQVGHVFKDIYNSINDAKIVGTYMFAKPGILIKDPELIKTCLVKDFAHFQDRGFFNNSKRDPLFSGLFFRTGKEWKCLRVNLSPMFTPGKIKAMFPLISELAMELCDCIENAISSEGIIEAKDILARYTCDVIASCAFGIESKCLKNPHAQFRQWGKKIMEPTLESTAFAVLTTLCPSLLSYVPLRITNPKLVTYFSDMVQDTVNYRELNEISRNDLLQLLIQLKNAGFVERKEGEELQVECQGPDDNNKLSMDDLTAEVFGFFLGGFEPSSVAMTFSLYELALNPEIQHLVHEEIDSILTKYSGQITYEAVQEMEYLDKVLAETLRKYPAVTILNREVSSPYRFPGTGVMLDKGTSVVVPILALHHDARYFPDPEKFDPERFSPEQKAKRHHYVYLPFGEGPRICIGMRFGLLQSKTGLVAILSRYNVNVSRKTPIPLVLDPRSFVISSVSGMWLKMTKRKCS